VRCDWAHAAQYKVGGRNWTLDDFLMAEMILYFNSQRFALNTGKAFAPVAARGAEDYAP